MITFAMTCMQTALLSPKITLDFLHGIASWRIKMEINKKKYGLTEGFLAFARNECIFIIFTAFNSKNYGDYVVSLFVIACTCQLGGLGREQGLKNVAYNCHNHNIIVWLRD